MNVLHVSNTDLMGGRFTGYYMQRSMNEADGHVEMAVWEKESENPTVHQIGPSRPSLLWYLTAVIRRLDNWFALEGLTGLGSFIMPFKPYFRRADLLHLHLIYNRAFFSMLAMPILSRLKPVVWTIHDCWPTSGMCVHTFNCERWLTGCKVKCPYPRGRSPLRYYTPAFHWLLKRMIYKHIDATLVVASKWMQDRVQRSPLLGNLPCHLIPFGIDLETFVPRPKAECRERLGIWPDQRVIVFRGVALENDRYKGMRWLKAALTLYQPNKPTCLLILDDGRDFMSLWPKYRVINMGWVDGEQLIDVLCAGDLFLMPSIQESFGLMAVESMACGTPVVVLEGTSLPEVIKAPLGGVAVPSEDVVSLAGAIDRLLKDDDLRKKLGRQGRKIAEQEYSLALYVERHLRLYEAVVEKHRRRR